MCPRQDIVTHDIWTVAVGLDNDFLSHGGVPLGLFMLPANMSPIIAGFPTCHPCYGRLQW